LALLAKPSTFAMTALLFTGACLSRVIGHSFTAHRGETKGNPWTGVCTLIGALFIVTAPYAYRFGRDAWCYFWDNTFGVNKEIWIYHGTQLESLLYYVSGVSFGSNITTSGMIITLLSLFCSIYLVIQRPEIRLRIMFLFSCIGSTLLINTLAEMKSPFLGGGIYGVWLFGSAYVIGEACDTFINLSDKPERAAQWKYSTLILCAIFVAAAASYQWPAYSNWKKYRSYSENYRLADNHIKKLLDDRAENAPKSILFTQAGPIVMENVGLWYSLHNRLVEINSATFCSNDKAFSELYPKYQWVFVQEQEVMGYERNMPSEVLMPRMLNVIKNDDRYHVISEFTALNGKKVWIYARK
jgi:hypothetical protein